MHFAGNFNTKTTYDGINARSQKQNNEEQKNLVSDNLLYNPHRKLRWSSGRAYIPFDGTL